MKFRSPDADPASNMIERIAVSHWSSVALAAVMSSLPFEFEVDTEPPMFPLERFTLNASLVVPELAKLRFVIRMLWSLPPKRLRSKFGARAMAEGPRLAKAPIVKVGKTVTSSPANIG